MQKFVYNIGCVGIAMICGMPVTAFASDGHSQPKNLALQTTNQDHTVTGVVLDESGQPVIGATIVSKTNPKIMSTTDVNGQFSINVKNSDDVLVFTYIGCQKKEVPLKGKRVLSVEMKEDAKTLSDVVVTAFGATQKKETVVGSIQQVKPENLRVPGSNISNAFAGRLAGVIATQSSGQPGANGSNFYIRGISTISGATSPLIVMDGMEISQDDLNHLDPDVIESFSILKDASATAMYGTRGANGVLIITTKSGADLEKPKITFRVEGNITTPTSKPKFVNGADFMQLYNEAVGNEGTGSTLYTDEQIANTRDHVKNTCSRTSTGTTRYSRTPRSTKRPT